MIDLSDGLASDARRLARRAACGSCSTRGAAARPGVAGRGALGEPVELAATGGEDYELLVCVPPASTAGGLTWIGEVVGGLRAWSGSDAPPGADAWRGYEH